MPLPSSNIAALSLRRATADIKRKTADWPQWLCDFERYEHRYVRGASFYVVSGRAKLAFSDGRTLDIASGDFVSIGEGAEAIWNIHAPIETRYCYHAEGAANGEASHGAAQ